MFVTIVAGENVIAGGWSARIEVAGDTTVEMVKVVIERETRLPVQGMEIHHRMTKLADGISLLSAGVENEDMLMVNASVSSAREAGEVSPGYRLSAPVFYWPYIILSWTNCHVLETYKGFPRTVARTGLVVQLHSIKSFWSALIGRFVDECP
ncbi:unnamed protein product [Discosporangium mesarthrocarpum]